MAKLQDLTGQVFGRLTVLERAEDHVCPSGQKNVQWLCQCECGNKTIVSGSNLKRGRIISCGCYQKERTSESNLHDLVGQVFGRLTVQNRVDDRVLPSGQKQTYWHCVCQCGNECDVAARHLVNGSTSSCGCLQKEVASVVHLDDLSGERFGRLFVVGRALDFAGEFGRCRTMWYCQCDCGNDTVVVGDYLKAGTVVSCGCYKKQQKTRIIDLKGRQFGKLTVISRCEDYEFQSGIHIPQWLCQCECGVERKVTGAALRSGQTTSCGCSRVVSKLEQYVLQYFNACNYENGVDYETQKRYVDLRGINNYPLSYDFLIYKDKEPYCLLECQGRQHYQPVELFGGQNQFEVQQFHDMLKKEYAVSMGVPLLEIPYTVNTYDAVVIMLQAIGI